MLAYRKNIHSQNGEDGVLVEILRRIGIQSGWVCEFGAWDGKYLSNTFSLIESNWKGVFIEGDSAKYLDLLKTVDKHPNITPVLSYVESEGDNSLDNILAKTEIPVDFDVLSIDIDSYDYQVWKSLENYRPRIVIVEINSGVDPRNMDHIHTPGKYQGTGFGPMVVLGKEKGYTLVCHTGNCIFVRNDLVEKLGLPESAPISLFLRAWWMGR